jgi:hypothetical protein
LLSSKLLRRYGCGQVDICTFGSVVTIYELKLRSNKLGYKQRSRLLKSAALLTCLLDRSARVEVINKLPKKRTLLNLNI